MSPDSIVNSTLEFKEYANILKGYLTEVGYAESSPQKAHLVIELDYGMGEAYLANSTFHYLIPCTHTLRFKEVRILF